MKETTSAPQFNLEHQAIKFCQKYNLNAEKQQIIASDSRNTLLYAVPGSGKTTVLVSKARFLIESGLAKASEMVILTFTRAAAEDMASKYESMFHPTEDEARPEFRTIHSFCLSTVLPYLASMGFTYCHNVLGTSTPKQQDDKPQPRYTNKSVIRAVLNGLKIPEYYDDEVQDDALNAISYIKNRAMAHDYLATKKVTLGKACCNAALLYDTYQNVMKKINRIDYDDILSETIRGIEQYPKAISQISHSYDYWFIDEAQDNSYLQNMLFNLMIHPLDNKMMVGDDDQSIYSFRGASPDLLLEYGEKPGVKTFTLSENRRSDSLIVEGSKKFIESNKRRKDKEMVSLSKNQGTVLLLNEFETHEKELMYVLDAAKNAQKNRQSLGILFRTGKSLLPLLFLFAKNDIPVKSHKDPRPLLEKGMFADFYAITDFALEPSSFKKFKRACAPLGIYPGKDRMELLEKMHKENESEEVLQQLIQLKETDGKSTETLCKLAAMLHLIRTSSPYEAAKFICEYLSPLGEKSTQSEQLELASALSCFAMAQTFDELATLKAKIEKNAEDTSDGRTGCTTGAQKPAVTVTTIHSAKGLEYDRVLMIDHFEEPNKQKSPDYKELIQQDPEEERRLFYVACTRAKHELDFLTVKRYHGIRFPQNKFIDRFIECCGNSPEMIASAPDCEHGYNGPFIEEELQNAYLTKYYAVKIGRNPGIYKTWAECEKQVKGFPSAQFKKFDTKNEAMLYLERKNEQ